MRSAIQFYRKGFSKKPIHELQVTTSEVGTYGRWYCSSILRFMTLFNCRIIFRANEQILLCLLCSSSTIQVLRTFLSCSSKVNQKFCITLSTLKRRLNPSFAAKSKILYTLDDPLKNLNNKLNQYHAVISFHAFHFQCDNYVALSWSCWTCKLQLVKQANTGDMAK